MSKNPKERTIYFALRIIVCCLGIASIAWGGYAIPIAWHRSGLQQIATHIIAGDKFAASVFTALAPQLNLIQPNKWGEPSTVRDGALIRLRVLETVIADGEQKAVDAQMIKLHKAIDESLANAPADPFLWTVLFWLENTQNGYNDDHFKYLRMSYALGPNEGWIAAKRNRFALAIFQQLPSDLAQDAKNEFVRLVTSGFFNEAADILVGPGWGIRSMLLAGLKDTSELDRQLFARTVYRLGYDVSVPGVEKRGQRPWD